MVARRILPLPPRMEIDEPAKIWMINYARTNYWRVAHWMSINDLIEDGFLTWYRIVEGQQTKGPRKRGEPVSVMTSYRYITDRPLVMFLFKRLYMNHITDLANGRTNRSAFELPIEDYMDAPADDAEPIILDRAPIEVQAVLSLLKTEEGRARMAEPCLRRKDGTRETTNERLSRLTGLPGNIATAIKSYFGGLTKRRTAEKATGDLYTAFRREGKGPAQALDASKLAELSGKIGEAWGKGLRICKRPVKAAIACGQLLTEAKGLCQKLGLCLSQWIKDNLKFAARTARHYMWIARHAFKLNDMLSVSLAEACRFITAPVV
jgi:hypothetical protein